MRALGHRHRALDGDTSDHSWDFARCRFDRAALRGADWPWPRGGARPRHRPSRSQAGEHLHDPRRTVKLLDFGLATEPAGARRRGDTARRTEAGLVLDRRRHVAGTGRGEHADARSTSSRSGAWWTRRSPPDAPSRRQPNRNAPRGVKEHPPDLTNLRSDRIAVAQPCGPALPGEGAGERVRDRARSRFALENLAAGSEWTPAPSWPAAARRAAERWL